MRDTETVFTQAFETYRRGFDKFKKPLFLLVAIYTASLAIPAGENVVTILPSLDTNTLMYGPFEMFVVPLFKGVQKIAALFDMQGSPFLFVGNSIFFALAVLLSLRGFKHVAKEKVGSTIKLDSVDFYWILGVSVLANGLYFLPIVWSAILSVFIVPFLVLLACARVIGKRLEEPLGRVVSLLTRSLFSSAGHFLLTCLASLSFIMLANSEFPALLMQFVLWNFTLDGEMYDVVLASFRLFNTLLVLAFVTPLFVNTLLLGFFSSYEKGTARTLISEIENIGTVNQAYGLLREDT